MVSISMGNQFRSNPVGTNSSPGRVFLTAMTNSSSDSKSPAQTGTYLGTNHLQTSPASTSATSLGMYPKQQGHTQLETFVFTMLSNAEKALRESSNTNAPLECWGCHGLYPGSNHLYKDCPHKEVAEVQRMFKTKLDEYLAKRKQNCFNPQT